MRIAACDDSQLHLNNLKENLANYKTPSGEIPFVDYFNSGLDLMAAFEKKSYDLLIVDILMPGINGMELAKDIRKENTDIPIVFLTSSPEFAVESYRVNAFDYLMKPINREDLYSVLNRISPQTAEKAQLLPVKVGKNVFSIPFSQIEYISVENRSLIFKTADGNKKSITGHLQDYESLLLARPEFIKIHRAYVANMDWMKSIGSQCFFTATGEEIPIARGLYKNVHLAYTNHIFRGMN